MTYILGTNCNPKKSIKIALTQIFGIGSKKALLICNKLGCCETTKVGQLTKNQIDNIMLIVTQYYLIDSELKRIVLKDMLRLIKIGCYRGFRHTEGLPLRGQRTHTNAKTCRKFKVLLTSKQV